MTSVDNTKTIKHCPWCGGGFSWGESSCKEGAKAKAQCNNSAYVSRIGFTANLEDMCTFECWGERLSNGEMLFTCSEEYYWQHRWNEVQYILALKFPRRKPQG